jgi:hypothetical protein
MQENCSAAIHVSGGFRQKAADTKILLRQPRLFYAGNIFY